MRVVVTDRARSDLLEVYSYLAAQNPSAAYDQIAAIDQKLRHLARFPFIGRERAAFGEGVRSVVSMSKIIFYQVQADAIVVLRVLDGRMDLDEEFKR